MRELPRRRVVDVGQGDPRSDLLDRDELRPQDDIVKVSKRGRYNAPHWDHARDVARVHIELSASVDHKELALF